MASQTLVITNLTTGQVDLSVGKIAPSGTLTVIVGDTIPADIISAQQSGVISYTANPVLAVSKAAKVLSTAGETNTLVQAGSTPLLGWALENTTTAAAYIHFYNKATAPTCGTDVPVFSLPVPAAPGASAVFSNGIDLFPNGLGYAISGGAADTDATSLAAGAVVGAIFHD